MDWDLDKGEILKTPKSEFDWLKMIFFMKEGIHDQFCKLSSDFKLIWQVTIFHSRLPQIPNHGLGLRQGWNSENSKKWVWLAQNDFFHERRHTRSFLQSFKWFQAFYKLRNFTPDFPRYQIIDWDLHKGEILKTPKNEFDWLKIISFMKEGTRDHFCKVSSDFKPFWQVTIFHSRLPQIPNHGLGLRQGWNSENFQKWVWPAQNDFFHERRNTRSFLQSFKWFQAILTSYHISQQTSPDTNHGLNLDKGEILKTSKNEFGWLKMTFFMKEGIHDQFCKVSSDFKLLTIYHCLSPNPWFHSRLPQIPNHKLGLRQGWNSENSKMSLTGSKWFLSWKKAYTIKLIFAKFQVISS